MVKVGVGMLLLKAPESSYIWYYYVIPIKILNTLCAWQGLLCFIVVTPKQKTCHSGQRVSAEKIPQVLSSYISQETSCGLHNSPWILEADPGQMINITLTDFSWSGNKSVADNEPPGRCPINYGYIFDVENDDIITLCGGGEREKHLYLSASHTVQVVLDSLALQKYSFLLSYRG